MTAPHSLPNHNLNHNLDPILDLASLLRSLRSFVANWISAFQFSAFQLFNNGRAVLLRRLDFSFSAFPLSAFEKSVVCGPSSVFGLRSVIFWLPPVRETLRRQ